MRKFFHRLKISQKLMLISFLFMIPDSVLLCLFLITINANIQFAQWEQYGNEYQRPLEMLLEDLPNHCLVQRHQSRGPDVNTERAGLEKRIDQALAILEEEDKQLGVKLQFTDEGLAKRQREHFRVQILKGEWNKLKADLPTLSPAASLERHEHLVADVRAMITHVGDTSNLILDPDLDSYYLMDVTLLALPQIQDRLAAVMAYGDSALARSSLTRKEQSQLAVYSALLKEADLDRVIGSTHTALNEDANFYGTSESLHRRVPPALQEFATAAEKFIGMITSLSETDHPNISSQDFIAAGTRARTASFALWSISDEELGVLLTKRIDYYRMRRARSLILTGLALVAAISFVAFITRSISRPLQKQAAALRTSNEALQAEIHDRERAESALRSAEEKYRGIFENAVEGIFQTSPDGQYLVANPTLARMYGYCSVADLQASVKDIGAKLYVDPLRRAEFQWQMDQFGMIHRFESQAYRKDGTIIWISEHARSVRDARGVLLYYEGTVEEITERKRNEAELEKIHKKLVDASRMAGMAEVATGVLHNVGNVLNSVNVSANYVADTLRKSKLGNLPKVAALLAENSENLGEFLTSSPKGKQLPGYIGELAGHLANENETLVSKMDQLRKHLDHVKEIVAMQQNYAKVSGVTEPVNVTELVEDALRLNVGALTRHQIEVVRDYESVPILLADKHKLLQILVNLVANAKHACAESNQAHKRITLSVILAEERVKIRVTDNGVGILPENLTRIFNHGFTTRKEGHGFGLHSGALAAREMGGLLRVESGGLNCGATFTIELPAEFPEPAYA